MSPLSAQTDQWAGRGDLRLSGRVHLILGCVAGSKLIQCWADAACAAQYWINFAASASDSIEGTSFRIYILSTFFIPCVLCIERTFKLHSRTMNNSSWNLKWKTEYNISPGTISDVCTTYVIGLPDDSGTLIDFIFSLNVLGPERWTSQSACIIHKSSILAAMSELTAPGTRLSSPGDAWFSLQVTERNWVFLGPFPSLNSHWPQSRRYKAQGLWMHASILSVSMQMWSIVCAFCPRIIIHCSAYAAFHMNDLDVIIYRIGQINRCPQEAYQFALRTINVKHLSAKFYNFMFYSLEVVSSYRSHNFISDKSRTLLIHIFLLWVRTFSND